ncbi:MAG: ABC transporter ATP-binding protein [Bacteroidota bacterium]
MMVLKVDNIAKSYGRNNVLKNVSFEMHTGGLYGIVGENGAGKSTLLKIIVGELKPDDGKISLECRLGYCPQEAILFTQLTVEEHFEYFSAAYKIDKTASYRQSEYLMNYFNFKKYSKIKISNLSGGTQQKLNLAIALLHKPDLLILDEPYSGFDWDTFLKFWELTHQLRKEGCSILVVSHLITEKNRFDTIFNLESGGFL